VVIVVIMRKINLIYSTPISVFVFVRYKKYRL